MREEIKVTVASYGNGRALSLYSHNPVTGKRKVVPPRRPTQGRRAGGGRLASRVEQRRVMRPRAG